MADLHTRLRLARMGAGLERCHKKPHLLRYSVGQHTFDVETLIILCWREAHEGELPRAELLVAAHAHDLAEIVTGDVPSPIKDLLGERLAEVDERVEAWLGMFVNLTEEEVLYLAAADRFELWLWCLEEAQRGNRNFLDWAESYASKWETEPLPWPFMDLIDEVNAKGVVDLTDTELKEAGGLNAVR